MGVQEMTNSLNIDINKVKGMSKSEVKCQVKKEVVKRMAIKIKKMKKTTKLRFIKPSNIFQRKKYITNMSGSSAVHVLKTRLNMLPIYGNYKKDLTRRRLCRWCDKEDDTTEHLLTCETIGVKISPEHLKNDDNEQLW